MKNSMKTFLSLFIGSLIFSATLYGQGQAPKVFILGEDEQIYEKLTLDYSQTLLKASKNDIKSAFANWLEMMQEIEAYAKKIRFDIKGVRLWMHVFWNKEGKIDHIGFLLRPDSRNIPTRELAAFLSSFMNRYTFPLKSNENYAHYTGASFPTFFERVAND